MNDSPKCDFCERKANVSYYPEAFNPTSYKAKLSCYNLCSVCDAKALKALKETT